MFRLSGNLENKADGRLLFWFIRSLPPHGSAPHAVRHGHSPRAHMANDSRSSDCAKVIGQDTPLPSLEVSSETIVQSAAGGGGSYSTLSFRDADSPLPMENNPRKVFLQLFGLQRRHAAGARLDQSSDRQPPRSHPGRHQESATRPRKQGQGRARRISRERSRD